MDGNVFAYCGSLESVFFKGDVPVSTHTNIFGNSTPLVYRRYGASGWGATGATFEDLPTAIWPEVLSITPQPSGYVFSVVADEIRDVTVQKCTNLPAGQWTDMWGEMMTGAPVDITVPIGTNESMCHYRLRLEPE